MNVALLCRTVEEGKRVIEVMAQHGLKQCHEHLGQQDESLASQPTRACHR